MIQGQTPLFLCPKTKDNNTTSRVAIYPDEKLKSIIVLSLLYFLTQKHNKHENSKLIDMAYTQEQLDSLESAISQGVLEVKYADKTVVYRSLADMMKIRDMMKAELGTGKSSRRYAVHRKGLDAADPVL